MRLLLTGADGFIGTHVHRYMEAAGHEVVPFRGNITWGKSWSSIEGTYDAALHLAAMVGTAHSMNYPARYTEVNVMGTAVMLEELHGRVGRVVLASSSATYGECDRLPETAPARPQSLYGATKAAQEAICGALVPTVALRLFGVYGPGQLANPHGGVVGMLASRILTSGRALVHGDGEQERDFVHVSDVCRAFELALEAEPGPYNIGTGVGTSILQLAGWLSEALGVPPPDHAPPRLGDSVTVIADPTKARHELGWQHEVSLADGLQDYCRWLREER